MASETQYKFFRELYDEENERYSLPEGRAKVFITILTLYIGALAFKANDSLEFLKTHHVPQSLAVVGGLLFVLSLACCVFSLRMKSFEALSDPEELIAEWPDDGIDDDDFLDDRIADLAVATNRNSKQNDEAAQSLGAAGWLLLAGVASQAIVFTMALWR